MDRIIGIDFGRKRTGIAVSDPLGVFATALDTIHSTKIIDYIKNYAQSESIIRIVVGYPKNMDNKPSEAAADVDVFLKQLAKQLPDIPVTLEDERFTSVLAHRVMIDGGMKASDRRDKKSVDKISAAIILQSYLDRQNASGPELPSEETSLPSLSERNVPDSLTHSRNARNTRSARNARCNNKKKAAFNKDEFKKRILEDD